MGVDLHEHNQEAYGKVQKAIADGKKKIGIAHATGSGKSYLIAKLFEDYNNVKKLVLVPSKYIKEQIQKLFNKYAIQNVDIMLYQKLIKMSDEDIATMDYDMIALDEYHHDTSKVWGEKVKMLINSHPESIIFGTSATPVRADSVNAIDELFEGNCVSNLPLSECIAKKIVPLPKYVGALYTLDDELERLRRKVENATNTKEEKQEFYQRINTMRSQIEKSYGMPIILNKHIKDKEGKYIVFCKNKKHLAEIKDTVIEWFRTSGCKNINAYVVHSSYENKDAEYKAFCDDTSHALKLMFCVDMLNEGLHLENISGVLLLRPTKSSIVWHQQIGRAIEANNTNTPVIIDAVNNFSAIGQGMDLLKEIKNAVAKEKESDPDFDDEEFEDIDTFFVLEQVIEIQEMFKEIEGRLLDDWDAMFKEYCKFYEENGHGDVPNTEEYRKLLGWCRHQRGNLGKGILKEKRKKLLNNNGFIWDVNEYRFENYLREIVEYHKEYGYPSAYSNDIRIKQLGCFIDREKTLMRKNNYPEWKKILIETYLPEFSCKYQDDEAFEKFVYYVSLYKKQNGHVNIKTPDLIDGYQIGIIFSRIKQKYNNNKLPEKQIDKLCNLGICLNNAHQEKFDFKIHLSKEAIKNGVVISFINQVYKEINLYNWINSAVKRRFYEGKLSNSEISIIETLINKPLNSFFNHCGSYIKIVDLEENKSIGIYSSFGKTVEAIRQQFGLKVNSTSPIYNRVSGRTSTPYKGRFMFYYATDEEVKKVFRR